MLAEHRMTLGLTQAQYASLLGVTQAYVSMLERDHRPLTAKLNDKLVELYADRPALLPLELSPEPLSDDVLAHTLGRLGYPGFAHLKGAQPRNPAVLVVECLRKSDVDPRVVAGFPWLLGHFTELDHRWLVSTVKELNLQNRLGFLAALAQERKPRQHLKALLTALEPARLAAEQTLCHDSMLEVERKFLRADNRPPLAVHWNLLTDLRAEYLKG